MAHRILAVVLLMLAACTSPVAMPGIGGGVAALLPADVLLLGEQHDAPSHQETHRRVVEALAARGSLAALALEMAEHDRATAGLPNDASEDRVRAALGWDEAAWPWARYAPAVMAAVRAGVAVRGANLPRAQMRAAMADAGVDASVAASVLQAQRDAVRDGHCGLLPEGQIGPMARVQIARDRAMARAVARSVAPGKTVVLLAGAGHVDPALGVPLHLPVSLQVRAETLPPEPLRQDYCAALREQLTPATRP